MVPPFFPPPHRQTVDLYGIGLFISEQMTFLEITWHFFFIMEKWFSWNFSTREHVFRQFERFSYSSSVFQIGRRVFYNVLGSSW